jgi:uncharacterized Tic20 family protein
MSIPPPDMPQSAASYGVSTDVTQEDKTMAIVAHILGIPTGFIGPLIIWLIKKDQSKFVAYHAFQALIFQAAICIGYVIASVLTMVVIGVFLYPVLGIVSIIFGIMAAMAANKGEMYSYPLTGGFASKQAGAL